MKNVLKTICLILIFLPLVSFGTNIEIDLYENKAIQRDYILAKSNLNKSTKLKSYIPVIDEVIEKVSDSKLINLYKKLEKLDLNTAKYRKYKSALVYLKTSSYKEIVTRESITKNITKNILTFQDDHDEIKTYYNNEESDRSLDDFLDSWLSDVKTEIQDLSIIKQVGDYQLKDLIVQEYDTVNEYTLIYKNTIGSEQIVSLYGKPIFLRKGEIFFDGKDVTHSTHYANNQPITKANYQKGHGYFMRLSNSNLYYINFGPVELSDSFIKEYSKIYTSYELPRDEDFKVTLINDENWDKQVSGEVYDSNVTQVWINSILGYIDVVVGKWSGGNIGKNTSVSVDYYDKYGKHYYTKGGYIE